MMLLGGILGIFFQIIEPEKWCSTQMCIYFLKNIIFHILYKKKFICWLQKVYDTKTNKFHNSIGYGAKKIKKILI